MPVEYTDRWVAFDWDPFTPSWLMAVTWVVTILAGSAVVGWVRQGLDEHDANDPHDPMPRVVVIAGHTLIGSLMMAMLTVVICFLLVKVFATSVTAIGSSAPERLPGHTQWFAVQQAIPTTDLESALEEHYADVEIREVHSGHLTDATRLSEKDPVLLVWNDDQLRRCTLSGAGFTQVTQNSDALRANRLVLTCGGYELAPAHES